MTLEYAAYLDTIGEETERLVDASQGGLRLAVPSCPGWRVEDLVRHVARVDRMWTAQLVAADVENRAPVADVTGPDPVGQLESEAALLLDTLAGSDPESPCWNWTGNDLTAGFVARRVALEVAVHRVDVEQARGPVHPVERELAVDGIDERLEVHLRIDLRDAPRASLHGSLSLVCDDDPAAWIIDVERGRLRVRHGRGPADAVAVGSASELFLFVWNRVPPGALRLTGDPSVAAAWADLPT